MFPKSELLGLSVQSLGSVILRFSVMQNKKSLPQSSRVASEGLGLSLEGGGGGEGERKSLGGGVRARE